MARIRKAEGYAIVENGEIDVRTVSPTRRAAIINFLVTSRRLPIYSTDTDEFIEGVWVDQAEGAFVINVDIKQQPTPF